MEFMIHEGFGGKSKMPYQLKNWVPNQGKQKEHVNLVF